MEMSRYGWYPHPSFESLHTFSGSGWYVFTERTGLGGIFRLTSNGAIPFNPEDTGPEIRIHDIYDVLRAVEQGRAKKIGKLNDC